MHLKINEWLLIIKTFAFLPGLFADTSFTSLPLTEEQLKGLANDVCHDIFYEPKAAACTNKFFGTRYETKTEPPSVQVKCRAEQKLTFAVPQSKDWQLVVLIPEEVDMMEYFIFNAMEPAREIGSIYTPPGAFTLWSALLNDTGSPSIWKKSPILEAWNDTVADVEERNYVVNYTFLFDKFDNATADLDVKLTWNATDPSDSCFEVYNRCNSKTLGNVLHRSIGPDKNKSIIATVPLDDKCTILVKGKYGTTKFQYQTPSCYDLPGCKYLPEKPENVKLTAKENGDSWLVSVKWRQPKHPPSYYNVTLRADKVFTIKASNLSSEAKFTNVTGRGYYNVTVDAINDIGHAVTFQRSIFPLVEESASVSLLIGAWAEVIVISTIIATFFVWWKRQRDIKKRNMYFPGVREKVLKDGELEICCVESGSEEQWEVKPERLLLHEVIGEGAFGVVRRATLSPDDKIVAVKMLKDFPSVEEIRSFRAEMELMKSVGSHPHVVSLVGCFRGRKPFIIAEYCSRGDLLTFLRCSWDLMVTRRNANYNNNEEQDYRDIKTKDSQLVINRLYDLQGICDTELTVLDLLSFCRQIAMGMEFLASNRVVHRDLAARNILVTADRTLKIADFGLSRDVYQENQYKQKGNGKMPVKWMALESLTHRIYTTLSDVWSFGVVMWEIVTVGGAPYPSVGAARLPRLLRAGYRMPKPSNCSAQLYEVMLSCWNERPRSRPTFTELHRALDGLLCASAHHYLDLQLPPEPAYPRPTTQRYVRMIMRGKWPWTNRYHRSLTTKYAPAANN
ncbi:tyrosine-protein kinase receptor torso-like [Pieris napi]|uniref:tyrosine-protein kinase receptor torso-like n=1 Tax=Pieris napi TaxID=78633 RepID=UPI001FBBB2F8|nr:tyrosine-protein kinase receptor torso-like [Pieris napi]XP_047510398.1 tyrosine-protein kinase receptor torso-like [Pieris napi]